MADRKASDSAKPAEMDTPPGPSPRRSSVITLEVTVSQVAGPGDSADVSAKNGRSQRTARRPRGSFGNPTRAKKRRAPSPSSSPASGPLLPPSTPPRKAPRVPSPRTPSPPRGSRSDPIEISSDDSEQEADASTAQTTPNPSPVSREKQLEISAEEPPPARPVAESRTVSAPATLQSPSGGGSSSTGTKSAQIIDGGIEEQIRNPKRPSKKDKQLGYVYVVPAKHIVDGTALIKIGFTAEASVDTRLRSVLDTGCKDTVRLLPRSASSPEHPRVRLFYEQVEKLAHRELANFRHDFVCGCGAAHREFFAVDEAVAHRVVTRWARFCELRPFTRDGALTDEWRFHLDQFGGRHHGRPGGEHLEETDDHVGRHQRWESFLASKRSDWYAHRAGVLRNKMWTHGWQLWSLALAFLLLASTPSWWSFVLLVATAGCVCEEPSTRESVVDLASLLRDMAAHFLKVPTPAVDGDDEVQETDGREGEVDIWDDSETGDGEPRTNREEADGGKREDKNAPLGEIRTELSGNPRQE